MATHQEVVENYAKNKINRLTHDSSWLGHNVFSEGDTLYSYGRHFILAQRLLDGSYIKNGDSYSVSTSGHQRIVQDYIDGPTVSFATLQAAGINPGNPSRYRVLDYTKDTLIYGIGRNRDTGEYEKDGEHWTPPKQGMFISYPVSQTAWDLEKHCVVPNPEFNNPWRSGYWHILGAALIEDLRPGECPVCLGDGEVVTGYRAGQYSDDYTSKLCPKCNGSGNDGKPTGRRILLSLDKNQYFAAELRYKARTVEQAFQQLKPRSVQKAEAAGIEITRQGEWFFIPTGLDDRGMKDRFGFKTIKAFLAHTKIRALPHRPQGHLHMGRIFHDSRNRAYYITGMVKHSEHGAAKLGRDRWYRAVNNTEITSWTSTGRMD